MGFLFVGGASRRMRRPKALLPWGHHTLHVHLSGVLRSVCDDVILVGDQLPPGYTGPSIRDAAFQAGPLGGLLSVLRFAGDEWRLILACDMPAVTMPLLRNILASRSPDLHAVVPQTPDGRLHPLCALYHQSALAPLEAMLLPRTDEKRPVARMPSVHEFLDAIRVARVPVTDAALLRNVNTVRDFLAVLGGHAPPPEEDNPRFRISEGPGNLKQ